ncbi:STAS domain-containing protein [Plantactinospora sonchi]|uniref:STAS domain-containing protein n=1 Tax=Plantactinospora sonchi TaxID=1544735 RepID=A0ABU7RLR9_9ACTN
MSEHPLPRKAAANGIRPAPERSRLSANRSGSSGAFRLTGTPLTVRHHLESTGSDVSPATRANRLPVISAVGEVDVVTAPLLQRSLVRAVEGNDQVCCDLDKVTFFSAAGLHALLAARHRATETGTRLAVRNVHGITRRILHLADVEDVLGLRP